MKLGKAFTDNISQEKKRYMKSSSDAAESWWIGMGRLLMFITALCVSFFILVWRLFTLTVVEGHHYRLLADGNRTRELVRHAPRGILFDRRGVPLVSNIPYYRLLKPCPGTGASDCVTPITQEEGDALSKVGLLPGTFLEVAYRRQYLYQEALSHVVGYTGELTEEELSDSYYKLHDYLPGDRIGRTGAEAVFEDELRGRDGKELMEVNAQGIIKRTLGRDPELVGENITLSLDAALGQVVMDSFPKNEKGAVIVSKPKTGEMLAIYSSPTFDVNAFSFGLNQTEYQAYITNPDRPLFNRAIGGTYPPASTFKLVIALAALEEGAITGETTVDDVGVLTIGPFSFPNWYFAQYGKTDGLVNVVAALKRSNDIFFYKIGERLGITKIVSWAKIVGIGKPLGIELAGEASGLMPDPAWKKERFNTEADQEARNDEWYLGDTYHVSIGQGYLLVTPLQVDTWTNIVANGGLLCTPTIRKVTKNPVCKKLNVKKESLQLIIQGMKEACATGGTGWPLFGFSVSESMNQRVNESSSSADSLTPRRIDAKLIPVACKTGTAEFGGPQNNTTHAWFTAFAPADDPEITVTVLVEGAGEGSTVAAPIAKKIFEAWFKR